MKNSSDFFDKIIVNGQYVISVTVLKVGHVFFFRYKRLSLNLSLITSYPFANEKKRKEILNVVFKSGRPSNRQTFFLFITICDDKI